MNLNKLRVPTKHKSVVKPLQIACASPSWQDAGLHSAKPAALATSQGLSAEAPGWASSTARLGELIREQAAMPVVCLMQYKPDHPMVWYKVGLSTRTFHLAGPCEDV